MVFAVRLVGCRGEPQLAMLRAMHNSFRILLQHCWTRVLAAAVTFALVASFLVVAPASAVTCENSSDTSVGRADRCIAGTMIGTRGYLRNEAAEDVAPHEKDMSASCVLDSRAIVQYAHYPDEGPTSSNPNACKGKSTFQFEALAQGRLIAQLNTRSNITQGRPGGLYGISPNIQWETKLPVVGKHSRPDLLVYDAGPEDPDNEEAVSAALAKPILIGELKGTWPGAQPTDAEDQLLDYIAWNPLSGQTVKRLTPEAVGGIDDHFIVDVKPCATQDASGEIKYSGYEFHTHAGTPGIILVDRKDRTCEDNDDPNHPIVGFLRVTFGRDANGDCIDDGVATILSSDFGGPPVPLPTGQHCAPDLGSRTITVDLNESTVAAIKAAAIAARAAGSLSLIDFARSIAQAVLMVGLGPALVASLIAAAIAAFVLAFLGDSATAAEGDPHLRTFDGLAYDLQAVGEFTLLDIPSKGVKVQTRLVPLQGSTTASIVGGVAFQMDGHNVELHPGSTDVLVDGVKLSTEKESIKYFSDQSAIIRGNNNDLYISFGNAGVTMRLSGVNLSFLLQPGLVTTGLLGNHDGDAKNDLRTAAGEQLPIGTKPDVIHGRYADSWRISDADSFFTYGEGQSTDSFTDKSFPSSITTLGDFSQAELEAAASVCRDAGVLPGPQFEDCVLDVAITGDHRYAHSAAQTGQPLISAERKTFEGSIVSEDFEGSIPSNFDAHAYLNDIATTWVAGPFFDTAGYSFNPGTLPRNDQIDLTFDVVGYGPVLTDSIAQKVSVNINQQTPIVVDLDGSAPGPEGQIPGTVIPTAHGNTADGQEFTTFRVSLTIPPVSGAPNIVLKPIGFKGLLDTAAGFDNISFKTQAPDEQSFNGSLPLTVTPDQPASGAGRLESPGAQDTYNVTDAIDGGDLTVRRPDCNTQVAVRTAAIDRTLLTPETNSSCQLVRYANVAAGDYRVEATSGNATAHTYSMRVSAFKEAPTTTIPMGTSSTTELSPGQRQTLEFSSPTAGARMRLSVVSTMDGKFSFTTVRPNGSSGTDAGSRDGVVYWEDPSQAGTYKIILDAGLSAGTVKVSVDTIAVLPDTTLTVNGDPVTTTLTSGQQQKFTFYSDTAGQRMRIAMTGSTSGPVSFTTIRPNGSTGTDAGSRPGVNYWEEPSQTGTYTIIIDTKNSGSSGDLSLGVYAPPEMDQAVIPTDGSGVATTFTPGQRRVLTFDSTAAGQQMAFAVASTMTGPLSTTVIRPDGSRTTDRGSVDGSVYWQTSQVGTYRIELDTKDSLSSGTMSIKAAQRELPPASMEIGGAAATTDLVDGQRQTLSFDSPTAGQRLKLSVGSTMTHGMCLTRIRPNGTQNTDCNAHDGTIYFEDPSQIGTYKIVIEGRAFSRGTASVQVTGDAPDATIPVNGDGVSTALIAGQRQTLKFESPGVGQRLKLTVSSSISGSICFTTLRPNGSKGTDCNSHDGTVYFEDPSMAGTYQIILQMPDNATGTVGVKVSGDLPTEDISVGGDGVTTTFAGGQRRTLTFTSPGVGQRLRLAVAAAMSGGFCFTTIRPSGSQGTDCNAHDGTVYFEDPSQAGVYSIVLQSRDQSAGTVTVKVTGDAPTAEIPLGDAGVTTEFLSGQRQTLTFTSPGVGQRLKLSVLATFSGGLCFTTIRPNGSKWTDCNSHDGVIYFEDPSQAGTYTIVLQTKDQSPGDITVKASSV